MSGATHIVGGFVFAGTLCSFTDVNIFENPVYIAVCAAVSILPDIDTTNSWLGKLFYPIAWLIYHKFGHRTITHSLIFLVAVWTLIFALVKFNVVTDNNYIKIVLFALISHYIFDMITVSGVPLFYPFLKNPCVMPGNPAYRFESSSLRSDVLVFGICGILCFSMQPLFANGFWTSYNRQFGTIKHVDRENRNTEFYVVCEYDFILNAENYVGEAIVIDSKNNELTLFDRRRIFSLNSDDPQLKINYTRPRISTIEKRFQEFEFQNISYDSIQSMLNGKLATGLIQSNKNVKYIENSITYHTNFIKFTNRFDFKIFAYEDTLRTNIKANIAKIEASIKQTQQRYQLELNHYNKHQANIASIEEQLTSHGLSNYERNSLQHELINLKNKKLEAPVYQSPVAQIAELEVQKNALIGSPLTFSGYMTVFTFGFDNNASLFDLKSDAKGNPIYDCEYILANSSSFPVSDKYAN